MDWIGPNWIKVNQIGPNRTNMDRIFFLNKRHLIDSKKKKKKKVQIFFFSTINFFVFNLNDMLRVFIRKSYVRVQICLFFRVSFMILLAILVVLNV